MCTQTVDTSTHTHRDAALVAQRRQFRGLRMTSRSHPPSKRAAALFARYVSVLKLGSRALAFALLQSQHVYDTWHWEFKVRMPLSFLECKLPVGLATRRALDTHASIQNRILEKCQSTSQRSFFRCVGH